MNWLPRWLGSVAPAVVRPLGEGSRRNSTRTDYPTSSHPQAPAQPDGESRRFGFGQNWQRFAATINEERIAEAERSLREMLGVSSLEGLSFLDAGCGSGLFSLAAARLGCPRVHSFDFDADSVACTKGVRDAHGFAEQAWSVEQASVLDESYLRSLGQFDVVYSWGVLHHTGALRRAMETILIPLSERGILFISIYNDQGRPSRMWRRVKHTYNRLPKALRIPYVVVVMAPSEFSALFWETVHRHPGRYFERWREYKRSRGMSRWHDLVDWVGGYPFEVAKPDEVFQFYRDHRLTLERLVIRSGLGCNEYVFRRDDLGASVAAKDQPELAMIERKAK